MFHFTGLSPIDSEITKGIYISCVTNIVPAGGLVPLSANTSAGAVMAT